MGKGHDYVFSLDIKVTESLTRMDWIFFSSLFWLFLYISDLNERYLDILSFRKNEKSLYDQATNASVILKLKILRYL